MPIASEALSVSCSTLPDRRSPAAARRVVARPRGFTLVELLASITIIAILAALATPSFIGMIRDRRVVRAGLILVDTYREARTRALSRGNSVTVRWTSDGAGKGAVDVRETIIAPAGTGVTKACTTSDWTDGSTDTRAVSKYDFAGTTFDLAGMTFRTDAGAASSSGEICFAPDGRTFVRYVANGSFTLLAGVPSYEIVNTRTNFKRIVFVPPNGVARYQL